VGTGQAFQHGTQKRRLIKLKDPMFNLEEQIAGWRQQMAAGGLKSAEVLYELESHLREEIDRQMHSGVSTEEAYKTAVDAIGEAKTLKAEFGKIGGPTSKSRKALRTFYFGSIIFIVIINSWTLLGSDTSPAVKSLGTAVVCIIGSYLFCLPSFLRSLPNSSYAALLKVVKLASSLVWLWPAWALLLAVRKVDAPIGVVLTPALLCLTAVIALSAVAYVLDERHGRNNGGPGSPPGLLPGSGQPVPPTRPRPPELKQFISRSTAVDPIVQESFHLAFDEACRLGHDFVGTEHLLLGILKLAKGSLAKVLLKMNVDSEKVRLEVERIVSPVLVRAGTTEIPLTPRARKAMKIAACEARKSKHDRISAEHVLLGLLLEGSGVAAIVLRRIGVRTNEVREAILREARAG